MHRGMQRLEAELQEKEHVRKVLDMEASGLLHDPARLSASEPVKQPCQKLSKGKIK